MPGTHSLLWQQLSAGELLAPVTEAWATSACMEMLTQSDPGSECAEEREGAIASRRNPSLELHRAWGTHPTDGIVSWPRCHPLQVPPPPGAIHFKG